MKAKATKLLLFDVGNIIIIIMTKDPIIRSKIQLPVKVVYCIEVKLKLQATNFNST